MLERLIILKNVYNRYWFFFSEYDFCQILVDNGDQLCSQMPEGQPCGCPLLANTWDLKGVKVPIPDFGILNNLMVVSFVQH